MSVITKREPKQISTQVLDEVMIRGDLKNLNDDQRLQYYGAVCKSVGLNPLTKPFEYITLNGKTVLYALRAATDQLRSVHNVSITITSRETHGEIFVVTARAKNADGREDESTGAVSLVGLDRDALANAYMKAETKAKRRVTLSICGLGLLDESEVETIPPDAKLVTSIRPAKEVLPSAQDTFETYVIPFGKFKGKKMIEITAYEIKDYRAYIERSAFEQHKEITGATALFCKFADEYVESRSVANTRQAIAADKELDDEFDRAMRGES